MKELQKICAEMGRVCPDETPEVLINVRSDFKIRKWVHANCEIISEKPKRRTKKEVKRNVEENRAEEEAGNESEPRIEVEEE